MGRGSAVAVASRAIVSVSLASGGARRESLIPISQHGERPLPCLHRRPHGRALRRV